MIVAFPAAAHGAARLAPVPSAAARPRLTALWLARAAARRELRALLRQPDSVIADCGLTRETAAREAAKPFWRD